LWDGCGVVDSGRRKINLQQRFEEICAAELP
jgi:hypothetical protein